MTGAFLQNTTKNFLKLKFGLGKITTKLQSQLQSLTSQNNLCTEDKAKLAARIKKIINQLKALIRILQSILKVLQKILRATKIVQKLLLGLLVLIQILKFLPIPARFVLVGRINRLGNTLSKLDFRVKSLLIIVTGLSFVISFISISLSSLITKIKGVISGFRIVVDKLKSCNNEISIELESALDEVDTSINDLTSTLGNLLDNNNSYKGFTFAIIEEQTVSEVVAKRRYAIALNSNGITVLQGSPSYATDTQVLIDELKLQIDNQNITGYPVDQTNPNEEDLVFDLEADDLDYDMGEVDEEYKDAQAEVEQMSEQDLVEIQEGNDTKKKSKFIKMLEKKSQKGNNFAKVLLKKISDKQITEKQAKKQWVLNIFKK